MEEGVNNLSNKIDNIKLPEIDTTELAKETTLNEFKGVVENVASIDADILQGKIKIANAIYQKGIPSKYTDSLVNMATKIGQISQELYTGTTDYDEMQFPMEYSYNAYRFAKDLMESELPAKYPSYLRDYLVGYGANSFWVGEFAIPYEEVLVLSMADAYYTSDGHFYTHVNGVVTHTLPDGSVETYESDVLEHKCPFNGMSNILIAHIYASDIYSVASYDNTNLIGVITCGKCDGFELKFHISYISGIGELNNVSMGGSYTRESKNLFYNPLIIKGMKKNNKALIKYDSSTPFNRYKSIILPDLEEFNEVIFSSGANGDCYCEILILPNLKKNNAYISAIFNNNTNNGVVFFTAGLIKLHKSIFRSPGAGSNHYSSIKTLHLPELEDMNGFLFNDGANGYFARDLERIYTPKLKRLTLGVFHQVNNFAGYYSYADKRSLIDFEVGEVETDMTLQFWSATNVLADPEKTIQLQNNIHNHIAERVKDVTGEAPLTITFSQGVRNVLLPETEALFAAKNWNIAPAKTV